MNRRAMAEFTDRKRAQGSGGHAGFITGAHGIDQQMDESKIQSVTGITFQP